jgi:hypothetical protein
MIGIDGSELSGSDWFCYHCTSACIFPVGFCEINNIDLSPPKGQFDLFVCGKICMKLTIKNVFLGQGCGQVFPDTRQTGES